RVPTLGPEPSRIIEWNSCVVTDVHPVVVNPRRPFAEYIGLGKGQPARQQQQERKKPQSFHVPVDLLGSHLINLRRNRLIAVRWLGMALEPIRNCPEVS